MPAGDRPTVLHFVAADADRGGILSVVRGLAGAGEFACVLGVNPGFQQVRRPRLETLEFPRISGEVIGAKTMLRALRVARAVRPWLRADAARVFHGHSRAGLLVALWLQRLGERRVVVSVHCYGRQRWFYRWAARRLEERLRWLTPAMKRYYGAGDGSWSGCIPDGVSWPETPAVHPDWRPHGVLRLGGMGALVRWKRWDLVLAALRQLDAAERSAIEFRHLGHTEDSVESVRFAAALHAQAAGLPVTWGGWRDEVGSFLDDLDVLVVSSDHEPFSMAMLEALAHGVPVLAADSGGPTDVITPLVNGWLFRSGDAAALAAALRRLLEPGARDATRIDTRSLQRFSAAVVARQWLQVYAGLRPGVS